MRFLSIAVACLLAFSLSASASPVLESQVDEIYAATYDDVVLFMKYLESLDGIDQATYDDLVLYTKYSSAVYQWICPHPVGTILVKQVYNFLCLIQDNTLMCALSLRTLVHRVSSCVMTTGKKLLLPSKEHLKLWTFLSVRKMGTLLWDCD